MKMLGLRVQLSLDTTFEQLLVKLIAAINGDKMAIAELGQKITDIDLNVQEVQAKLVQYFETQDGVVADLRAQIEVLKANQADPAVIAALEASALTLEQGVQSVEDTIDAKLPTNPAPV